LLQDLNAQTPLFPPPDSVNFVFSFERTAGKTWVNAGRASDFVIPAWSAGIQADMDVSGCILRTLMPAIHAGMTERQPLIHLLVFMFFGRE
jgi:hypothetical protein